MLEPNEKAVFDGIVTRMRAEDPRFSRRLDRIGRPRRGLRTVLAVLLWTFAPVSIIFGGWTGFFLAILALGYGARLMAGRQGWAEGTLRLPRRKPGVSN